MSLLRKMAEHLRLHATFADQLADALVTTVHDPDWRPSDEAISALATLLLELAARKGPPELQAVAREDD